MQSTFFRYNGGNTVRIPPPADCQADLRGIRGTHVLRITTKTSQHLTHTFIYVTVMGKLDQLI